MEEIGRGAEAVIYRDGSSVIKDRQKKGYRIAEIDNELRKFRSKREAKVIKKLSALGVPTAKVISEDEKACSFKMEFLDGQKLRDILSKSNYKEYCSQIGQLVAKLHSNDIIHDDLTTSNMIVVNGKIHLIDFGLSFFSERIEDKAVDLHLLRQALESKHQEIWKEAFDAVIDSYRTYFLESEKVLVRFETVEMRGRYKQKRIMHKKEQEIETGECE